MLISPKRSIRKLPIWSGRCPPVRTETEKERDTDRYPSLHCLYYGISTAIEEPLAKDACLESGNGELEHEINKRAHADVFGSQRITINPILHCL